MLPNAKRNERKQEEVNINYWPTLTQQITSINSKKESAKRGYRSIWAINRFWFELELYSSRYRYDSQMWVYFRQCVGS